MKKHTYTDEFEAFWKAMPHPNVDPKKPAFCEWQKALKIATVEEIMASVGPYRATLAKLKETDPWYKPPHTRKWLKDERWEGYKAAERPKKNLVQDCVVVKDTESRALNRALFILANKIGLGAYDSWIAKCKMSAEWKETGEYWDINVAAPSKFICDTASSRYGADLGQCLLMADCKDFKLSFIHTPVDNVTRETEVG